jgi:ribose transport system substrate-binding protein
MASAPGMQKVAEDTANWAQDAALSLAQNMLTANPDINVIWGQADAMAQGAAEAVRLANLGHPVLVVGFDGDVTALPDVASGKLAATMVQQVVGMGELSVTTALDLVNGKTVPPEQLQEAFLATKDNVAEYIAQHP